MSSLNLPTIPKLPSKAKFWKKRSANISDYDPTFRVIYLGNVLTGWAKGEGCVDKPLATLWKNHMSTDKPNIIMKVTVCASGLKAVTKEHGLTEYWAHRITFCEAEPSYPKVFCWIYRHEGRKMKQELRCHAVLCPSENKARMMAKRLKERLHQALVDFKKEKVWKQNARLSLANAADEQKTMPFRKIMLQAGSSNYRPPLEKGKSAPKLKVIEEVIFEEDEEDLEDNYDEHRESYQIKEKTDQPIEDTNHITRLSLDGLSTSESMPLLSDESSITSRCTSSLSMDQLSTITAITTSFDVSEEYDSNTENTSDKKLTVQNLIVISKDPSPDLRSRCRPRPKPRPIQAEVQVDSSDDEDDDSDEVTDYLEKLNIEVANIDDMTLEDQSHKNSSEASPRQVDSDGPASPLITTRLGSNSEQDTISDESGYSEESNPSNKDNEDIDLDEECDLTVKGVLISDFSPSEQLKYLQKSQSTQQRAPILQNNSAPNNNNNSTNNSANNGRVGAPPLDIFQNKVPEFCINI